MFAGINLGEYLTWSNHIKAVKNKASAAFYALAKVQNLLPSNIKLLHTTHCLDLM